MRNIFIPRFFLYTFILSLTTLVGLETSFGQSGQVVQKNINVNGVARDYLVYLPAGFDGTVSVPVMISYHGGSDSAQSWSNYSNFKPLADANNFIAVYPNGLPDPSYPQGGRIWNSVGPYDNGNDDIGFTSAMIDELYADYAIDRSRVYACGYSNGGNICWELAAFLSDKIAAVGPVAGSMWTWTETLATPTRSVPIISIHGTFDFYNPWDGGQPYSLGLVEANEYWAGNNNANLSPRITPLPDTNTNDGSTVEKYVWGGGNNCVALEHYKVIRGGHDWPGKPGANRDINATELIWEFCSQYSLNGKDCISKIGVGAGGANIASLDSTSIPTLGSNIQLNFSGFNGSGNGFIALSLRNTTRQFLGGTVFPDINNLFSQIPINTDANGNGSVSFAIGNNPSLLGLTAYSQVGLRDSSQSNGWAFSNGLAVTIFN
jgi:polyhydroxybutyrate depolymerase